MRKTEAVLHKYHLSKETSYLERSIIALHIIRSNKYKRWIHIELWYVSWLSLKYRCKILATIYLIILCNHSTLFITTTIEKEKYWIVEFFLFIFNLVINVCKDYKCIFFLITIFTLYSGQNFADVYANGYLWSELILFGLYLGYDMSPFIRRYAKYLNEKALSYRTVAFDFCKVKRGWVIKISTSYFPKNNHYKVPCTWDSYPLQMISKVHPIRVTFTTHLSLVPSQKYPATSLTRYFVTVNFPSKYLFYRAGA